MNISPFNVCKQRNDDFVYVGESLICVRVCVCVFCVPLFTFMFHPKVLVSVPTVCIAYSVIYMFPCSVSVCLCVGKCDG